ncbi:MAG: aldolase/citrate lyase family protein [Bacillota bacterium]
MGENRVKQLLRQDRPAIGNWINLPSPAVAEFVAGYGMDWLVFDTEHGPYGEEAIEDLLRAVRGSGVVPLVRVAGNDPVLIKKALDRGAGGIICPLVNTEEEARAAVAACRYPPDGIRGVAGTRASDYGRDLPAYFERWNDEVLIACQMETVQALENVEAIAAVDGLDVLFIGPADLSASLGLFGQSDHPEVRDAVRRIVRAARENGIAAGYYASGPEEVLRCIDEGMRFVACGSELKFLGNAAGAAYETIRRGLSDRDLG